MTNTTMAEEELKADVRVHTPNGGGKPCGEARVRIGFGGKSLFGREWHGPG